MKKLIILLFGVTAVFAFANVSFGIVQDNDLLKVGVKKDNILKAKSTVDNVAKEHQKLILERKQLELEVNKYIVDGASKNIKEIEKIFDRLGFIEAKILKVRIRGQIELQKNISQEQYLKARAVAVERINNQLPQVTVEFNHQITK